MDVINSFETEQKETSNVLSLIGNVDSQLVKEGINRQRQQAEYLASGKRRRQRVNQLGNEIEWFQLERGLSVVCRDERRWEGI